MLISQPLVLVYTEDRRKPCSQLDVSLGHLNIRGRCCVSTAFSSQDSDLTESTCSWKNQNLRQTHLSPLFVFFLPLFPCRLVHGKCCFVDHQLHWLLRHARCVRVMAVDIVASKPDNLSIQILQHSCKTWCHFGNMHMWLYICLERKGMCKNQCSSLGVGIRSTFFA